MKEELDQSNRESSSYCTISEDFKFDLFSNSLPTLNNKVDYQPKDYNNGGNSSTDHNPDIDSWIVKENIDKVSK